MKKLLLLTLALCFLLTGCSSANEEAQPTEPGAIINPLPDSTMDNLSDAILSVSLEEGDAYVDDTGKMQMDVKIYTYDKYDMVDIAELEEGGAYVDDTGKMQMDLKIYSYDKYDMVDISMLKVGDVLVTHAGEVEIRSLEHTEGGSIAINGGLDAGGFELVTDDNGIFYEQGFNDAKNWYEVGEATIRVSVDFRYYDNSDFDKGEVIYYPGSFLVGEVTDYHFYPHNTTIRVENGQIIEMHRVYVP